MILKLMSVLAAAAVVITGSLYLLDDAYIKTFLMSVGSLSLFTFSVRVQDSQS